MRLGRFWAVTGLAIAVLMGIPRDAAAFWDWIHELSGPSMMGPGYTCKPFEPRPFIGPPTMEYLITTPAPHGLGVGGSVRIGGVGVLNVPVVAVLNGSTFKVRVSTPLPDMITVDIDGGSVQARAVAISHDRCFSRDGYTPRSARDDRFHYWVRLEGYYHFSVKHNDNPEGPHVHAVSAAAMFEVSPDHPGTEGTTAAFFGAGLEQFRFMGKNFKPVDRLALKLRPVAVRINRHPLRLKAVEYGVDVRYFPTEFVPQDFGVQGKDRVRDGGEWTLGFFFSAVLR